MKRIDLTQYTNKGFLCALPIIACDGDNIDINISLYGRYDADNENQYIANVSIMIWKHPHGDFCTQFDRGDLTERLMFVGFNPQEIWDINAHIENWFYHSQRNHMKWLIEEGLMLNEDD